MKRFAVAAALVLPLLAGGAEPSAAMPPPPPMTPEQAWQLSELHWALQARDCKRAIAVLNEGLAGKSLAMMLAAGTMFEEGLCVRADWQRAEGLYLRAYEGGHRAGLLRLAAGYAYQRRDPAAALYWLQRHSGPWRLPSDCSVPAIAAVDAELFVKALQQWPAERLRACVYVSGVLASIIGEFDYPVDALLRGVTGAVRMKLVPATGATEWRIEQVDGETLSSTEANSAAAAQRARLRGERLRKGLQALADRALNRYERPAAVPPEWVTEIEFVFIMVPN